MFIREEEDCGMCHDPKCGQCYPKGYQEPAINWSGLKETALDKQVGVDAGLVEIATQLKQKQH